MTDQNLPGENTPEASETTPSEQVAAALSALADVVAPPAPAKRTRARRATAAPKTAGDALAEAGQPDAGTLAGDSVAPADEPAAPAEVAATKPARRTRSRKPASTAPAADAGLAAAEAPSVEAAASEPDAESGAAPVETAAAPRARKRATSSRTRKAAQTPDEPEAVVEAPTPEAEPEPQPEAAPDGAGTTSSRVGGTSRLATTALLFQAPEPGVRPRRRRAEAPAGPPRHPVEDGPTETAAEDVEELDELVAETGELEVVVEPVESDIEPEGEGEGERDSAGRRRRRRGGRGRRGRSGSAHGDEREDEHADEPGERAEQDEPVDDAGPAEPTRRRSGRRGARPAEVEAEPEEAEAAPEDADEQGGDGEPSTSSSRRRRRRRRSREGGEDAPAQEARPARVRARTDEVTALKGSTRLEAKRQRRREGRDAGRRRTVITEAEFLARRESVERTMIVRENDARVQIAIVEDGVLVEHYVSRTAANSGAPMAGNVYLGRVQNVLPSMEAAFVDIGKGRNAVLYAGEVNWDAAGLEGQPRRIEQALKSGDSVLVQVTKEPVGHKGARLTSQITLAGRYLVYVPGGGMTGISRKLPDTERARLKRILKEIVPDDAGVIVRTAAEGASDDELRNDVQRLQDQWTAIERKSKTAAAPALLQGEPDLAIRVVRDVFNDDFTSLVVQGEEAWQTVSEYVGAMAPDLESKISRWTGDGDVFAAHRIDEQLAKGMDRKVWLPSGGSLVIDRTEAMTVIDVNTGKFTGSGGTLEETVTRNNLEAAEEIVRQLRLRDIGGIIVIDFIDMVLESNRDLVLRRLVECLGRDRTKHQVAEVTSLGLVQMTRKRVGQGLLEAFSEPCQHCNGRGFIIHSEPVSAAPEPGNGVPDAEPKRSRRKKSGAVSGTPATPVPVVPVLPEAREAVKATLATIAAAAAHAHEHEHEHPHVHEHAHENEHEAEGAHGLDGADAHGGLPAVAAGGEEPATTAGEAAPEPDPLDLPAVELADAIDGIRAVGEDEPTA